MTPQQAKELAPILAAYGKGETIQFRIDGREWKDNANFSGLEWGRTDTEYRIKPKPVTRPWSKPEDVPGPVCWVRNPEKERLVIVVTEEGITAAAQARASEPVDLNWKRLAAQKWEYSTDRKTWHPCTVTEEPA